MTDVVEFEVTALPESALKKLSKAQIPVYKLKKRGKKLYFGVNKEYIEKVFAIFRHPCYNVCIRNNSKTMRLAALWARRSGFFIGAAVFTVLALLSQRLVLAIKITGSGSYLSPEITALAEECGAKKRTFCSSLDKPLLQAKILSLPGVSFCSVQREGAYLLIDVRAEESQSVKNCFTPLISPVEGVITRLVTVCGTAEKSEGESVKKGDKIIGAYTVSNSGEIQKCLCVGYAEICVSATVLCAYEKDSEQNAREALSSTSLYSDRVVERELKVKNRQNGVTYEVSFKYLVTAALNME